jgi:hypothetical protein
MLHSRKNMICESEMCGKCEWLRITRERLHNIDLDTATYILDTWLRIPQLTMNIVFVRDFLIVCVFI